MSNTSTKKGKLIIFSAPSGAGKSSIVQALLKEKLNLEFSISATSRLARGKEVHGKEYYFLSPEEFRSKIRNDEFLEWEEVYQDTYYGTLKNEVDRITKQGKHVVFDVDVVGGLNIKKQFGHRALALFIQPPSVEVLHQRLIDRGTDTAEKIKERVAKAESEMAYARQFDAIVINDHLDTAIKEAKSRLIDFLNK
jgi:guanylate kinase